MNPSRAELQSIDCIFTIPFRASPKCNTEDESRNLLFCLTDPSAPRMHSSVGIEPRGNLFDYTLIIRDYRINECRKKSLRTITHTVHQKKLIIPKSPLI